MSTPAVLGTIHVGTKYGPVCHCRYPRKPPIDVCIGALPLLRGALARSTMQADTPILTWRCRDCKGVVTITAADLHLAA